MNNKEIKKYSTEWYDQFRYDDTRFYGVWVRYLNTDKQSVKVDMKRFCSYFYIDDYRKNLKSNKNSQFYKPSKSHGLDYKTNYVKKEISKIEKDWQEQKLYISKILSEIKGWNFTAIDDDNLQMGYVDYEEAATNARMMSYLSEQMADYNRNRLNRSMYAQYFHQFAAQIDALILRLLTNNGWEGDTYNRDVLLAFKGANKKTSIKELESYKYYNKMYSIWNFLKHNSLSTHKYVLRDCPEILLEDFYNQGDLSCFIMDISDALIDEIIDGVRQFLVKYCQIVFNEDEEKAEWDFDEFFLSYAYGEIQDQNDPLGLSNYFY